MPPGSAWRRMKGTLTFKHLTIEFETPDEWLANTALRDWLREPRAAIAYRTMHPPYPLDSQDRGIPQVEPSSIPLQAIEPVHRTLSTGTPFASMDRLLRILAAFQRDEPLPPVHTLDAPPGPYRFTLFNGLHRYLGSVAVGFTHPGGSLAAHQTVGNCGSGLARRLVAPRKSRSPKSGPRANGMPLPKIGARLPQSVMLLHVWTMKSCAIGRRWPTTGRSF